MNNKIVIGTWPTSGDWGPNNISETIELYTKSFFEYGFKEYDTAPNYGNGFSEFILGKIFYNQNVKINTKVGNLPFGKKSFKVDDIKESVDQSLQRLNRSSINILFLHNPRSELKDYEKIIKLLNDYKSSNIINGFGISCAKGFNYDKYVDLTSFDYLQDDINLLCLDRIIDFNESNYYARSPLASGILSGKMDESTVFDEADHRSSWLFGERLKSLIQRVKAIRDISGKNIIDTSSRFLLHSPQVYKVIFGIRKISHLDRLNNIRSSEPLNHIIKNDLINLYKNDFGLVNETHLKY